MPTLANTDVKKYNYGSPVRHTLRIEQGDRPADPDTLVVYFVTPLGTQEGPFTPTRRGVGLYYFPRTYSDSIPANVQGTWYIKWVGTGLADGNAERRYHINSSPFTV